MVFVVIPPVTNTTTLTFIACLFRRVISMSHTNPQKKPLMLNTLGVRSALGAANRRKLSFRNVSNVVVQLLHTIKYSVPVPFSHMATGGSPYPGGGGGGSSGGPAGGPGGGMFLDKNARKVSEYASSRGRRIVQ